MPDILFVCRGNTCRSILAEAIFKRLIQIRQLGGTFKIASAGTHVHQIGRMPHKNTIQVGDENDIDLFDFYAKPINPNNLTTYDYVIAMDKKNISDIRTLSTTSFIRTHLFLEFSPQLKQDEITDPYDLNINDYRHAYNLIMIASMGLLDSIEQCKRLN